MHIFSILFTAQDVDAYLRTPDGIADRIAWCQTHGLSRVYIESFREGLFIDTPTLISARDAFLQAGIDVRSCVTPVGLVGSSKGPDFNNCYSDPSKLTQLERIFRRTAEVFDVIIIDDFLFTQCTCDRCNAARGGRSFAQFHCDLMHEISMNNILRPAKEVNPNCKIIIKYPNWYDEFQYRGYDVLRQSKAFDMTWVGTETRDTDDKRWGAYPQTAASFLTEWMIQISGEKMGGGWYDWLGTSEETYLEQARETILGGAKESILFCHQGLTGTSGGQADVEALRKEIPRLHELAYRIEGKERRGVVLPKKCNYDAIKEKQLPGFFAQLGIPVIARCDFDLNAPSLILTEHASELDNIRQRISAYEETGKPLALTRTIIDKLALDVSNATLIFDSGNDMWEMANMPSDDLNVMRNRLLRPLGIQLDAPSRVSLHLFDDDLEILENFNSIPVNVTIRINGRNPKLRRVLLSLGQETVLSRGNHSSYQLTIPARSLAIIG